MSSSAGKRKAAALSAKITGVKQALKGKKARDVFLDAAEDTLAECYEYTFMRLAEVLGKDAVKERSEKYSFTNFANVCTDEFAEGVPRIMNDDGSDEDPDVDAGDDNSQQELSDDDDEQAEREAEALEALADEEDAEEAEEGEEGEDPDDDDDEEGDTAEDDIGSETIEEALQAAAAEDDQKQQE